MIKKKILPVAMILSALFIFGACSPVVEKEPEQSGTPVVENTPEEEPTGFDEEILEVSEEYEDQAVELAMFALTNYLNKTEDFSNEDRREALSGITHPDYVDHLETQNQVIDALDLFTIDEIEVLGTEIQDEETEDGEVLKRYVVAFQVKETIKEPGKEIYEESNPYVVMLMLHENQFKLRGFANLEFNDQN